MTSSTANSERRKNTRRSPPSLIYVELGPSNGGMMRDLSAEGFALRAMMPVQAGAQTPFSFALNANARIEGQGEILWVEENGRLAGIRFADLPAQMLRLIQSWLEGTLENPEPEKPGVREALSFEELREELRAPQPRREPPSEATAKPHWDLRPSGPQVPAVPDTENEVTEDEQAEPPPFTLAPEHTPAPEPVEFRFEPLRDAQATEETSAVLEKLSNEAAAPVLPDISDILIQPPASERAGRWNPLDEMSEATQREAAKDTSTGWFTLSRAIGIMVLLALAVAFSVYHQALGEGLIWLGKQLGGSAATQAPAPAVEDKVTPPATSEPDSNIEVTRPLGATVPSLPQTKNAPPAAVGSTGEPDSGQDTGSPEYAHALQLLHDKDRGADLSEAVRLLWIAVEKGNPSAELTLAELYWRGEGVARNCDQTRILLSAAARKGNSDAETRLRQFEREGCE